MSGTRSRFMLGRLTIVLCATIAVASPATADVTVRQKTVSAGFGGFGDGTTVQSLVISGDKSRSDEEFTYTGRFKKLAGGGKARLTTVITRLDKDLIWNLDVDEKRYTELTFEEMREAMSRGAMEAEAGGAAEIEGPRDADMEFQVDVRRTGKKETVNGFAAEQVVITLTGTPKSKEAGEHGTVSITMDQWLSQEVPGGAEAQEYARRMAEKLGVDPAARSLGQMATAMYGNAIRQMAEKLRDLKGYPVRSTVTIEAGPRLSDDQQVEMEKAMAEAAKAQAEAEKRLEEEEDSAAKEEAMASLSQGKIGGAWGGLLGKKTGQAAGKEARGKASAEAAATGSGPMFTSTTDVLSVSTTPAGASFEVPAGFKKVASGAGPNKR